MAEAIEWTDSDYREYRWHCLRTVDTLLREHEKMRATWLEHPDPFFDKWYAELDREVDRLLELRALIKRAEFKELRGGVLLRGLTQPGVIFRFTGALRRELLKRGLTPEQYKEQRRLSRNERRREARREAKLHRLFGEGES